MSKGTQVQVVMPPSRKGAPAAAIVTDAAPAPETAGVKRNAKMWSWIATWLGRAAVVFAIVSALFLADLASDLGATWGQVAKLTAIALAGTVVLTLMPPAAALLEESHPARSERIMLAWRCIVFAAAAGVVFFVARSGVSSEPRTSPRAQELRAQLAAPLAPSEWEAWRASQACEAPPQRWRATCDTIKARRAQQWAEVERLERGEGDWSPAALIGSGVVGEVSETVRRLLAGAIALAALYGAGMTARLGAQMYDEANRRADGIMPDAAARGAAAASVSPPTTASMAPIATVDLWFRSRVVLDQNGTLSPTDAYEDYKRAVLEQGLQPVPQQVFFNWLAGKAAALGIEKGKRSSIRYIGMALAGEIDMGELTAAGDPALLPYD